MRFLARQLAQRRPLISARQLSSTSALSRAPSAALKESRRRQRDREEAAKSEKGSQKGSSAEPLPEESSKPRKKDSAGEFSEKKLETRSRFHTVGQGHDPETRLRLENGKRKKGRHSVFRSTVIHRFNEVLEKLISSDASIGSVGRDELSRQAALFMNLIDDAFDQAERNITDRNANSLFWNLREAFILRDLPGLTKEIQYSFQSYIMRQRSNKSIEKSHQKLLDFRFPHEWFPATRTMQRTIHAHVGPTNSGKTYNAIKALENSKSGVYAGPLRLLATEIYQRLNAKGHKCALVTGEEQRFPEDTDQYFTSCTVEMTPINQQFDVAVIDEIQMISDPFRGSAWTAALLGVQAKEVHVCGEERTVGIIQAICNSIGDKCVVHRYERLSPLETMNKPIAGNYSNLEKGDAIVAFNRLSLHALKRNIEKETGRRCAIVYGTLPPEVRVQQAALFNEPDNEYDFIVASDAIGMGLNLEIRRVIMESVTKFDGESNRLLSVPEAKQIGGRAGRYRTARTELSNDAEAEKVGMVTTMDWDDLKFLKKAFQTQPRDIKRAVISPPPAVIERYASYFPPDTPLSYLLMRIKALGNLSDMYELHIAPSVLEVADVIQDIPLKIYDRLTFLHVPVNLRAEGVTTLLRSLATVVSENKTGALLDLDGLPLEVLDLDIRDSSNDVEYLHRLESLHTSLNMYLWLSYRYTGMFRDQHLAFHIKEIVEKRLILTLEQLDFTDKAMASKRRQRRLQAQSHKMAREAMGENELLEHEDVADEPPLGIEDPAVASLVDEEGEEGLREWTEDVQEEGQVRHG